MQARYLAALILLELGFYLAAGVWLGCARGVSTAWCILLAVLTAIGLRLGERGKAWPASLREGLGVHSGDGALD